jgi:hypothetical protein
VVAYLDLHDPRCYTLSGWLTLAARRCQWSTLPSTLADFAESVEATQTKGQRLVLCLDQFEEVTKRRDEFTRDFFLTLRACSEQRLSIVTASQRPLSELTERDDPSSPFFNAFPLLRLGPLRREDVEDLVNLHRPGTPAFTIEEKEAILEFAKGHPLAVQVACYYVLEAKSAESISAAIRKATDEMRIILPHGW